MDPDNEDNIIPFPEQEPPQETHESLEVFTQLATEHGFIRPGDKLDQNMIDFAHAIVEKCASIGDGYHDHRNETCAGDHIRAVLGSP